MRWRKPSTASRAEVDSGDPRATPSVRIVAISATTPATNHRIQNIRGASTGRFESLDITRRSRIREPVVERRSSRKLRHGSRVVIVIPEELRLPKGRVDGSELTVLYEDEEVLAIDKPAGMPVHPSGRHVADTLIQQVHARYRSGNDGLKLPIRLCHRLDRETSGVLLVAKGDRCHADLMAADNSRTRALDLALMKNGLYVLPGVRRFVSAAHTDADFEKTLAGLDAACRAVG